MKEIRLDIAKPSESIAELGDFLKSLEHKTSVIRQLGNEVQIVRDIARPEIRDFIYETLSSTLEDFSKYRKKLDYLAYRTRKAKFQASYYIKKDKIGEVEDIFEELGAFIKVYYNNSETRETEYELFQKLQSLKSMTDILDPTIKECIRLELLEDTRKVLVG